MEYRLLGASGLKVPVISFGAATFGGSDEFYRAWGTTHADKAIRLIDVCIMAVVSVIEQTITEA